MDRDKLNKAAEEARMASAETLTTFGTHHYIDDVVAVAKMSLSYDEVAESAFIKGAEWLMQQPLSERLTEEEKQALCSYFNWEYWDRGFVSDPVLMTRYNQGRLGGIFGADIFK